MQLYETMMTRHTVMVVGPTGGGKTVVIRTLAETQTRSRKLHSQLFFLWQFLALYTNKWLVDCWRFMAFWQLLKAIFKVDSIDVFIRSGWSNHGVGIEETCCQDWVTSSFQRIALVLLLPTLHTAVRQPLSRIPRGHPHPSLSLPISLSK